MKVTLIIALLLLNSCEAFRKECHEKWSIKGRLINGTTLQPIARVPLNFDLFDGSISPKKVKNQVTLGSLVTDDSGYFNFEYDCNNKHSWDLISIYSKAPYQGVLNSLEDFQEHFNKVYYWSNMGTMQIKLKPKAPLNGDTLFIAFDEPTGVSHKFIFMDSFTNATVPAVWKTIKRQTGGGRGLYWGRGKNQFLTSTKDPDKNPYSIKVFISGDPTINDYTIEY